MTELVFDCVRATADRYAAGPTLVFRLRISETTGARVHAIALRCQIRIEPMRRLYTSDEARRLRDLFGDTARWGDTLKPVQFALVSSMVPGFTNRIETDLVVPCTYDLEIASTSYLHGLDTGEIPLLLLYSGTVFTKGATGFSVEQLPWHKETSYRLPVSVWRTMMDSFYPSGSWLRLSRETIDALGRFKSENAIPTWDTALATLLDRVEHPA